MKLPRRVFLRLAASAAALPILPRIVRAETYPNRPVHVIVGLGPGSAVDIITRLANQKLSERLSQPFIVENRVGAAGSLAAEVVLRAQPDGYTLLAANSADSVNATLHNKPEIIRDIAPIASFARGPLVLVVHPSFPAKTVPEFIAYAKAHPGKINFGSAGIGSVVQLAAELFNAMAGTKMVHVPYHGMAPALTDLIAGRVQVIFSTVPPAIAHVRAGRLRALAVTSTSAFDGLPGLPPVANFLPGYEVHIRLGLGAPKDVPAEIVDKLNKEINAALAEPAMKAKIAHFGMVPAPMAPAEFGKFRVDDMEKWKKVIQFAGIKPA
ncbi:MAG: tripartite tricarboxylate transporter substrate binding protein [Terriglobia bacterium]